MARGLRSAWIRQATTTGAGAVARFDGVVATLTGLPDDTLNVAFVEHPPANAAGALREADAWFTAQGQRIGVDVERGRHPDVERAAAAFGLGVVVSRPAMAVALDDAGVPPRPLPGPVEVVEVTGGEDLDRVRAIQSQVFHLTPEVARRFLSDALLGEPGYRLYLARVDGEPAGTASYHADDRAAGVFGVCAVPSKRRRGVGTTLTHRCLVDAAGAGCDLAWLQSTPEGLPMYARLGFEVAGDWDVWAR